MEEEVNHDDVDEFIAELVERGILLEHIDEATGETMYSVSNDAAEKAPALWETHVDDLKKTLYRLFMAGMVTIMFSEEGPLADTVALTDLAFDKEAASSLDHFDQQYLQHLINVFEETI